MNLRDKRVMGVWMFGLIYIVLSFSITAFYLVYVVELPFESTVWMATATAIISLSYAWTAYVNETKSKTGLFMGYVSLFLLVYLFYLEPNIYGGGLINLLEPLMPATASALKSLTLLSSAHQFALYWTLSLFLPLIILWLLLKYIDKH